MFVSKCLRLLVVSCVFTFSCVRVFWSSRHCFHVFSLCGSIVSWFFFWRYIGVDGISCFLSVLVFDCFKYCIEKVFVFSFYKFAVFPGCHFLCDCNLLLIGEFYVTNAWCNVLVDILLSAVVGFHFFAPVYLFSWYDFIISYVCMIVFF